MNTNSVQPAESKIWACPRGCGYHIADGPVPDDEPTTSELIHDHMAEHEDPDGWTPAVPGDTPGELVPGEGETPPPIELNPDDPYAEQRAAYVAGLRALADWWEQHTEIPPERNPSINYQPEFHGERMENGDDAEGFARLGAMAAALGVEVEQRPGMNPRAECLFGPIRVNASYPTRQAMAEYHEDLELVRRARQARAEVASAVLTPDAPIGWQAGEPAVVGDQVVAVAS